MVYPVFAYVAPSAAGLGQFRASDSPPRGSLAKNRGQEGTAGEHEEIAKYDCGRPARPVVKMHEVDDPGDDQGKAAEKGRSAEAPDNQTANEHHGAIGAVPGILFVFVHVIGPSVKQMLA
jgi:hypothetical protein